MTPINITLESLGILTGKAGHVAALQDQAGPEQWQARIHGDPNWSNWETWYQWSHLALHLADTQWRRKSEVKREPMREPMRYEYFTQVDHRTVVGTFMSSEWDRAHVKVTVEEIVDKPANIPLQPAEAVTTVAKVTADEWIKELERELSESRAVSKGLEKACDGLRHELASALGSQKAAVAALEVERKHGEQLRHKTECLVRRITGTGTRDIVRDVVALLNEAEFSESTKAYLQSNETAGKESG